MVTYSTAVKNARLDVVQAAIEGGAGVGQLRIRDSGNVVLVTIPLEDGQAASGGALALIDAPATAAAGATGTAANAIITDSAGVTVASGLTVGLSASDVILDSLSITNGQDVTINSATLTHG